MQDGVETPLPNGGLTGVESVEDAVHLEVVPGLGVDVVWRILVLQPLAPVERDIPEVAVLVVRGRYAKARFKFAPPLPSLLYTADYEIGCKRDERQDHQSHNADIDRQTTGQRGACYSHNPQTLNLQDFQIYYRAPNAFMSAAGEILARIYENAKFFL
jgi:hypothetical protein